MIKELENYKVENMFIMNSELVLADNETVKYKIEDELSEDEKRKFIDSLTDGLATYLYFLIEKYQEDEKNFREKEWGGYYLRDIKKWIKTWDRRDRKNENDTSMGSGYFYESINHYNCTYVGYRTAIYKPTYISFGNYEKISTDYEGRDIVHKWFHELLKTLESKEREYFRKTNILEIKKTELQEVYKGIHFNNSELNDMINRCPAKYPKDITVERLQQFIDAYKKVHEYVEEISKTL
jgi:hypothetical protein